MDTKIAARMIAVFAIGAGLTAAITALHDDEDRPDADAPASSVRAVILLVKASLVVAATLARRRSKT
ncbi:hypothetical protein [Agrobacterium sp. LMR679]|uniref:hypothetical protein n=1 Tax=Agrobacterium sp. LMR679 TaxID=3014335 RepID=UPI0022B05EEB|nr:hypothetical protein [Agrobacterium sp. LMR679]MCZ4072120.1 hypothetical protein [Agrobacterium sp. LMR679]